MLFVVIAKRNESVERRIAGPVLQVAVDERSHAVFDRIALAGRIELDDDSLARLAVGLQDVLGESFLEKFLGRTFEITAQVHDARLFVGNAKPLRHLVERIPGEVLEGVRLTSRLNEVGNA